MILSFELAIIVDKYLRKSNCARNATIFDENFTKFTIQELDKIKELELENFNSLNGISKLRNLKSLKIVSLPFQKMHYDLPINNNMFINHISDFKEISKLVNLEELIIENDINIQELDLTNLKKLQVIHLKNNPHLIELKGLDELLNLVDVFIYGCNIDTVIDIEKYFQNTYITPGNILDITMYPGLIKKSEKLANTLYRLSSLGFTKLEFAEQVGMMDYAILTTYNLKDMFRKINRLFNKYSVWDMPEIEKINFVHNYVVSTVAFAEEELQIRINNHNKYSDGFGIIPDVLHQNFAMIHTSFAAAIHKRSNCEGSVNLMRIMLNILGIKSHNVHCTGINEKNKLVLNHSAIRVLTDGEWLYFDPTFERRDGISYSFQTKEEFKKTHILNILEQQVEEKRNGKQYTKKTSYGR